MSAGKLRGSVKFFNPDKAYGFIARDDGQGDVFVHISGVAGSGADDLAAGDRVEFELGKGAKGPKAVNVRVLEST